MTFYLGDFTYGANYYIDEHIFEEKGIKIPGIKLTKGDLVKYPSDHYQRLADGNVSILTFRKGDQDIHFRSVGEDDVTIIIDNHSTGQEIQITCPSKQMKEYFQQMALVVEEN